MAQRRCRDTLFGGARFRPQTGTGFRLFSSEGSSVDVGTKEGNRDGGRTDGAQGIASIGPWAGVHDGRGVLHRPR